MKISKQTIIMIISRKDFPKINTLYKIYTHDLDIDDVSQFKLYEELLFLFHLFIHKSNINESFVKLAEKSYTIDPDDELFKPEMKIDRPFHLDYDEIHLHFPIHIDYDFKDSLDIQCKTISSTNKKLNMGGDYIYMNFLKLIYLIDLQGKYGDMWSRKHKYFMIDAAGYNIHCYIKSIPRYGFVKIDNHELIRTFTEFISDLLYNIYFYKHGIIYDDSDIIKIRNSSLLKSSDIGFVQEMNEGLFARFWHDNYIIYDFIKNFINLQLFLMVSFGHDNLDNYRELIYKMID